MNIYELLNVMKRWFFGGVNIETDIPNNRFFIDGSLMFKIRVWENAYPSGNFMVVFRVNTYMLNRLRDRRKNNSYSYMVYPLYISQDRVGGLINIFGCKTLNDVKTLLRDAGAAGYLRNTEPVCIFPVKHGRHDDLLGMGCRYDVRLVDGSTGLYVVNNVGDKICRVGDLDDFDDRLLFHYMFASGSRDLVLEFGVDDFRTVLRNLF